MENNQYLALVSQVVRANRVEIEQDLTAARRTRDQATNDLAEAERRVLSFEFLLSLVDGWPPQRGRRMSLHDAMRAVLSAAPGRRMAAGDLAREVNRRGLYKMRDGRPVEPQQIHARVGHYPELFDRNDRGIGLV